MHIQLNHFSIRLDFFMLIILYERARKKAKYYFIG